MMINELVFKPIFQIITSIGIFAILVYVINYIVHNDKLIASFKKSRFSNPLDYFPSEGILILKQGSYLVMILLFLVICLYLIFDWNDGALFIFSLDIIVSTYLAIKLDKETRKNKIIVFLLIPFGSITGLIFKENVIILLDVLHIIGYFYFMNVYYRKFVSYTENNGLGIAIILLYAIILVSFLFTIITEDVSPMDSMTMVSNAFTSNSFEASGKIMIGKINSLILAWGGFTLSCIGTATLAVSIVKKYVKRQFDEMKDLIKQKKEEN